MRICFVAYFNEQKNKGDMGTKNVALSLAGEISKNHDVLKIDIRDISSWKKARIFKPDVIHFVLAPTTLGFVAAKIFTLYCNDTKVIMSAPNPTLSAKWLISHLMPHFILIQSAESENFFQSLGFKTRFLPNGVDINRFVPVSAAVKEKLREKYNISNTKFVVLHVGPVIRERNIERLTEFQGENIQVIIIGRKPVDSSLLSKLQKKGIVVINEYISNVEELYGLSDCYVFPTDSKSRGACIEIPLSVLEAMACNLPVISTEYGALPRIIEGSEGFLFYKNSNDLCENINSIKNINTIKTRELVTQLSWAHIAKKLEGIYFEKL
jgi:glycosyltransferase involved in cell wall biosynthesis